MDYETNLNNSISWNKFAWLYMYVPLNYYSKFAFMDKIPSESPCILLSGIIIFLIDRVTSLN